MTSDTHQALADILSVITAIGGYLTPGQQDAVRRARAIVAAGGGSSAETHAETATLERYRAALQAILGYDVEAKHGRTDEWGEASAWDAAWAIARDALAEPGESVADRWSSVLRPPIPLAERPWFPRFDPGVTEVECEVQLAATGDRWWRISCQSADRHGDGPRSGARAGNADAVRGHRDAAAGERGRWWCAMSDTMYCDCECMGCSAFHVGELEDGHAAHAQRLMLALDRSVAAACRGFGVAACDGADDVARSTGDETPCQIGALHTRTGDLAFALAQLIADPSVAAIVDKAITAVRELADELARALPGGEA